MSDYQVVQRRSEMPHRYASYKSYYSFEDCPPARIPAFAICRTCAASYAACVQNGERLPHDSNPQPGSVGWRMVACIVVPIASGVVRLGR
jgi:hypothetical protein